MNYHIGEKHGQLKILSAAYKKIYKKAYIGYVLCRCDCGKEKIICINNVISGKTRSCGCLFVKKRKKGLHKTHKNLSKTLKYKRLYSVWRNMCDRCINVKNQAYKNYGGRGIGVCNEWKNDFWCFYDWACKTKYKVTNNRGYTIDRIDNNGDYCPENCRWANAMQQALNRRTNHFVEYKGDVFTIKELSDKLGIKYPTLLRRVKVGSVLDSSN